MKVTIFQDIRQTTTPYFIDIDTALDRIKTGKSIELVQKIRSEKNKSSRDKLKSMLPCICFCGTFKHRSKDGLINQSGYAILDFDHVDNLQITKEQLIADEFIFACWISPSGDGLKALVKVPIDPTKYESYYNSLINRYPNLDTKNKDISRVCYESYDPEIHIRKNSKLFDKLSEINNYDYSTKVPDLPIRDEVQIIDNLTKWLDKSQMFANGNRNFYLFKLASSMNRFGITQSTALDYCMNYSKNDFSSSEIESTIKSAYKQTSDHGKSYFENASEKQLIRKKLSSGKIKTDIIKEVADRNNINLTKASDIVELEQKKLDSSLLLFWSVQVSNKGKIEKIDFVRHYFIKWLTSQGFYRYPVAKKVNIYVHIRENIIKEVDVTEIRNYVFNFVENMTNEPFDNIDKNILWEFLSRGLSNYFSKDLFDLLPINSIKINKDTKTQSFFYYQNYIAVVCNEDITLINYSELDGAVWEDQIIERPIILLNELEDFENTYSKFLRLITQEDSIKTMLTSIGYLLHRFKDKTISKTIIFNDRVVSDNPEGGTGKGLILEGIKKIRRVVSIDGKKFEFNKAFAFQRINVDTEIIFFDDVKKNFDFEKLFSIITEGIEVEKKNQNEFFIPFDNSPKIAISTNYYIKGEGSSNDRRKVDVELTNYFNAEHTPKDEFNGLIFDDWNSSMWIDFDNFMLWCCRFYLKNGIVKYNSESIQEKKLLANTSAEFLEFITSIAIGEEIDRKICLNNFIEMYGNYKHLSAKVFIKWIKAWAIANNIHFEPEHRRSGNNFYMKLWN